MLRSELAMLRHQIANIDSVTARQKQSVELAEGHYSRVDNDNVQLHAENKLLQQQLGARLSIGCPCSSMPHSGPLSQLTGYCRTTIV